MYPGTQVREVVSTPMQGVFEIRMGRNVAFTDKDARYLIFGAMFDSVTQEVLTKRQDLGGSQGDGAAMMFPQEHITQALKTVRGKGSRVIAVFSDPRCGYCRMLENELAKLDNVTVYTFMYAALGEESKRLSAEVWCSENRIQSWSRAIQSGNLSTSKPCDHPTERNIELGQRLGIQGTPTIIAQNGASITGYRTASQIEQWLSEVTDSRDKEGNKP